MAYVMADDADGTGAWPGLPGRDEIQQATRIELVVNNIKQAEAV
jgi:hypothetical protein